MASPQTYPMIIHCRMGADRTGEIVAMLEGILGCSDAQIILDYTWSSLSTFGRRDTASLYWKDFILYLKSFDPEGGTIQKGTWNFLLSIGVTAEELDAIRNIFLCKDENSFQAIRRTLPGKANASGRYKYPGRVVVTTHRHGVLEPSGVSASVFDLSGRLQRMVQKNGLPAVSGLYIKSIGNQSKCP
jgi:hypothetical protein